MSLITFEEVKQKNLLICGDDVYDIAKFASKHPGGPEILSLCGSDATLPMINAHGVLGELPKKLPKNLKVGQIDAKTLDPIDIELRSLWARMKELGLFTYKRRWLAEDIIRGLGLWAAASLMLQYSVVLSFILFVAARLNVIWWVHDVCHDAVFKNRDRARFWAEWVSLFFVGTTVLDYQYIVHRIHHGFTNLLDADQALDTGPVVWHHKMIARSSPRFVAIQAWFWFLVILPLTLPFFVLSAIVARAKKGDWFRIMFIVLRWTLAKILFADHLVLLIVPVMAAGYVLSLTASLNHFHRPIQEKFDNNSFAPWVTHVTQNLRERGPFVRWFTGGLNFHIEHHFFSTMPRRSYPAASPYILLFCRQWNLPYHVCSTSDALKALWHKLSHPFAMPTPVEDVAAR
jgi:fatty acid desaturase